MQTEINNKQIIKLQKCQFQGFHVKISHKNQFNQLMINLKMEKK